VPDNCKFSSGEVAQVDGDDRLQAGAAGCTFEKGAVILLSYDSPEDGSAAPAEDPAHTKKEDAMPNPTPAQQAPVAAPEAAVAPAPAHAEGRPLPSGPAEVALPPVADEAPADATGAHTEVPAAPSADDMSKIMESAGGNPMLALGMAALVIVGGGGAMWKFIQQKGKATSELEQKRADQEHELKLRELELKTSQSSGPDYSTTQPPPCQAASVKQEAALASLRAEMEEVKAKLSKVERKSMSFSADFDADEIVERLEKAEKEVKALKVARRGKGA